MAETMQLSPSQNIDFQLLNGRIDGGKIINDPKIGLEVMEQWKDISDASVKKIKELLIQYADVQKTVNPNASGWVLALARKQPGDITLDVWPRNNGTIRVQIKDKASQNILSEFTVGTTIAPYNPAPARRVQELENRAMSQEFKDNAPSYIQVLEANGTTIKLKTMVPQSGAKGGGLARGIGTTFDADLWEITLKTSPSDPFNKMQWMDAQLSTIIRDQRQLNALSQAGFNVEADRRVAIINTSTDSSFMIPTRDGTGFATICPGGQVNIYDKNNPIPAGGVARKPVIYLYPQKKTKISVSVELKDATMVAEYPKSKDGIWKVEATPRGNLLDEISGKKYSYLFWKQRKKVDLPLMSQNQTAYLV